MFTTGYQGYYLGASKSAEATLLVDAVPLPTTTKVCTDVAATNEVVENRRF
jgi:hypothetical protein